MPHQPDTLYTRALRALQDTTACPACTARLQSGRCGACGLDVSGPDGVLVWQDSQAAVRALSARQDRVDAMRAAQAAARAPRPATDRAATGPARVPEVAPAPVPTVRAATVPVAVPPDAGARTAPPSGAARAARADAAPARRPWRVQTVLQVVGAALLVAASITFLVFAWDVMGLRGRAAVVGVGTLVVFALASWLRARRLPQGAEAVGAVAVVLLLLDAWAVRATGVVSVGDGTAQAGVSVLVCAALLTVWGVRSRLRAGTVAGAALVPLAPLAWLPAFPHAAGASALLLAAGALTAVRAVPPWCGGRPERTVLRAAAAVLLPPAVLTACALAVVRPDRGPWHAVALLAAAVVVLALQVTVEARTTELAGRARPPWSARGATAMRAVWAAAGGVTAVLAVATASAALAGARSTALTTSQVAVVGACAAAAGLLLLPRRAPWDGDVRVAARAGLVVVAAAACWTTLVVVTWTGARLSLAPPAAPVADPGTVAVGALLAVGALAALVVRRTGGRTARAAARAGRAVVVLVAVVVPVLAAAGQVADLVLVAGEAVVVVGLLVAERRTGLGHGAARTGAVVAVVLAVLGAAPHAGWSAAALLLGAALAVVARSWSPAPTSAPASTVASAALLLAAGSVGGTAAGLPPTTALALAVAPVGAGLLARARARGTSPGAGAERDAALGALVVALTVAWPAASAAVGPAGRPAAVLVVAAPLVAATVALTLATALLRWGRAWGAGAPSGTGPYVALGAGALAPVGALSVATANLALGVPPAAASALLVTMVGVVSAVCAPLLRSSDDDTPRHSAEAAGAVVAALGVAVASGTGARTAAVALLLTAVGTAAWALAPGRSRGWWLSLALATSAWWVLLGSQGASVVEPYTLPPALVLTGVGAWRVARRRVGAPPLLGAGLALATLPTAMLPAVLRLGARWVDRGLVTAGAAVVLVGAALLLARHRRAAAEVVAGLGALLLVLGPLARAVTTAWGADPARTGPVLADGTVLVEAWSWPAALTLAACAAVVRAPRVRGVLDVLVPWALLAAAAGPTLIAVVAAPSVASSGVRAAALELVAVALALVGGATGRRTSAPGARRHPTGRAHAGTGLTGLGLVLLAAATTGVTAVVTTSGSADLLGTARDLPLLVAGLVTLTAAALTARRGDAPGAWCVVGVLALLPSLTVRGPDLRLVLWGATAAVLLGLATIPHGARRPPAPVPAPADASAPGEAAPPVRPLPDRLPAADVARVLGGGALAVVVLGPWLAALASGTAPGVASVVHVELVAVVAALVARRHARTWRTGPVVRHAPRAAVVALLVLPSVVAVDASTLGTARGLLVLVAGGAVAWWARDRVGTWLGLGAATLATAALALRGGPEPVDVPWTVLGLLALALGARRMTRDPAAPSWPALGLPLALTLGAPFAGLVAVPAGWRVATLLALGVVAVVAGAVRRWQAPLLLGAGAVLATLVVVLSPLAASALAAVDGWILLAVGGALVLGLGVTYERRVQQAREAVRFVREMR